MYTHKKYVYMNEVYADNSGIISVPTVNANNAQGGEKLKKNMQLAIHSLLIPISKLNHEQTLRDYSKKLRLIPTETFTSKDMWLKFDLTYNIEARSFDLSNTSFNKTIIAFTQRLKYLVPDDVDLYFKKRYFLKVDDKTWDHKRILSATDVLNEKKLVLRTNITGGSSNDPYNKITIFPDPASNDAMSIELHTNKLQINNFSTLSKYMQSYYDVFVPPDTNGNEWGFYNYADALYTGSSINIWNTNMFMFIYSQICNTNLMPRLHVRPGTKNTNYQYINHLWITSMNNPNRFIVRCNRSIAYGSDGMYAVCFYVPVYYKDIMVSSKMYVDNSINIELKVMDIDFIVQKTIGSKLSKDEVKKKLIGISGNRKQLLRVVYKTSFIGGGNIITDVPK